jgi:hypothetical protein
MKELPIVRCFDDGHNYRFWCQFCHRWHYHGRMDGTRVPHCMKEYGEAYEYVLKRYTKTELKWIRAWCNLVLGDKR